MFKERRNKIIGTAFAAGLSVAAAGESKALSTTNNENIVVVSDQVLFVQGRNNSLGMALEKLPEKACEIKQIVPVYKEVTSNVMGGAFIVCEKGTLIPENILPE